MNRMRHNDIVNHLIAFRPEHGKNVLHIAVGTCYVKRAGQWWHVMVMKYTPLPVTRVSVAML